MNRLSLLALTLATATLPFAARAQINTDTRAVRPPAEQAPAAPTSVEDEPLTEPAVPAAPPAMIAEVTRLRATTESTAECYTAGGRMEHEADASCPRWYAQLARGGRATVFAIAGVMLNGTDTEEEGQRLRNTSGEFQRGPRLVQILASTRAEEAVPVLLAFATRTANDGSDTSYVDETDRAVWAALTALTGNNPAPRAPWQSALGATSSSHTFATRSWLRWYREHQGQTRAQWVAEGQRLAVEGLQSEDPAVRVWAIQTLAPDAAQRAAVTTSMQSLLARNDLPARARVYLQRFARQRHIALAPAAAPVVASR